MLISRQTHNPLVQGILALFLLEMGLIAASQISSLRRSLLISASLGVTFPFNILVGLPLYLQFANMLHRLGG